MNVQSRGYVDPSRWDDGVPAAFVDYYFFRRANKERR